MNMLKINKARCSCDKCNGNISFDKENKEYRCDECGTLTDKEGYPEHDV